MSSLFEGGENAGAPAADLRVVSLLARGVAEARLLEGDPVLQSDLYHTLGGIYRTLGSLDEADRLLTTALELRRSTEAEHPADVAAALIGLAEVRFDQARYDDAERLAREALALADTRAGAMDVVRTQALTALGRVLREKGAFDEAARCLQTAIDAYATRPDAERDLSDAVLALAETEFYAGRIQEAEAHNLRVLVLDRRLYGERHPNVAHVLLNLAAIDAARNDNEKAEARDREALGIMQAWFGADHPETASARTILAQQLVRRGQLDEALAFMREALAVQERVFGPAHPRTAFVLNELGLVAFRKAVYDEAGDAFRRAADAYRAADGKRFQAGVALVNLGSVHLAQHRDAEAERIIRDALALYAELLPDDHQNVAIAKGKLGRALVRQRRYQDAEPFLTAAYAVLHVPNAPATTWLQAAREDLATLHAALGDAAKAEAYRIEWKSAEKP
jgi:serine/threonine-protein kinase